MRSRAYAPPRSIQPFHTPPTPAPSSLPDGLVHTAKDLPTQYDIVELSDAAVITKRVAAVAVSANEVVHTDAMRCLFGFCAFTTTLHGAAGAPSTSYAYRINTTTAAVIAKTPLLGDCAHMHVDYNSGNLYTLCLENAASGPFADVVEVSGAAPVVVAKIAAAIAGGAVLPGQTTHCSAYKSMYIAVSHGGAGMDTVVTVDLVAARVKSVVKLADAAPRALWATCTGDGEIGGVAWAPGAGAGASGTASFGEFSAATGAYKPLASVAVPATLEPTGLLTETETEQAIAVFMPRGTRTNATIVDGALWSFAPFAGTADSKVADYTYNLIAASLDRDATRR